jgi:hypothetical protein
MAGAPIDFGGRVLEQTNPPTPAPHLDTDPLPTDTPVGAVGNIDKAPLQTPKMDADKASLGNPANPKPQRVYSKMPFDPIGDVMRKYKIPMTRENYVALNHLGETAEATPEEDAETPTRFQPHYPTHEELEREKGKLTEPKGKK